MGKGFRYNHKSAIITVEYYWTLSKLTNIGVLSSKCQSGSTWIYFCVSFFPYLHLWIGGAIPSTGTSTHFVIKGSFVTEKVKKMYIHILHNNMHIAMHIFVYIYSGMSWSNTAFSLYAVTATSMLKLTLEENGQEN